MAIKVKPKQEGTKVITGEVRLSYAHILEAYSFDGKDPMYSVCILIDKDDTETVEAIEAAIETAKKDGAPKWGNKIPKNLKLPLRDGDEEREEDPAFINKYFINCNSKQKPGIIDISKKELTTEDDIYSGCYARVSINFFPFSNTGNNGIAAGLNNIQKLRDGERFAGKMDAADEFDDDFELDGNDSVLD